MPNANNCQTFELLEYWYNAAGKLCGERDNGYDNRVAGFDSPSQNRKNPPLRFIVLLSRRFSIGSKTMLGYRQIRVENVTMRRCLEVFVTSNHLKLLRGE